MTSRAVIAGFGLGLLLSASQACIVPFECIYLYSPRPKLCAPLLPVPSVDGGFITNAAGDPPEGCACLSVADKAQLMLDPLAPSLDPLWAAIDADAKAQCEQLALDNGQDPSACSTAQLNKQVPAETDAKFEECKELIGTIDEDQDGYCPLPGETGETDDGETGGDTTDSGAPPVPDLGIGLP